MDDMSSDDPASYVHLGSVFFAIAIVVWTSVAVWLCYSGPPGSDTGDPDGDGSSIDGAGDLSDSVIGRVAHGFAELLLESKEKAAAGTQCDARTLDLSKLESILTGQELFGPSNRDCKGHSCAKKGSKGLLAKVAGSAAGKDAGSHLSPRLAGLSLGGRDDKGGSCDPRTAPSPARAAGDHEGRGGRGCGGRIAAGAVGTADLAAFREQLREKIASSLSNGAGRKGGPDDLSCLVAASARSRTDAVEGDTAGDRGERSGLRDGKQGDSAGDRGERSGLRDGKQASGARREALEDFVKQLLHPPSFGLRGKLAEVVEADDKEGGSRPATMLSMAEHAREIGNKYFQDRHFAAAAHCYEVACLLCPAGNGGPGQLAAYHCNCALACLELGRYGDAINEGNAALVLTPPKHLAVKALYRLAVAHANLKNAYEARRSLKRCLELDPLNEYARAFLARLGEEEEACTQDPHEGRLTWIDPPKRVQCLGAMAREKAKGKKMKQKNGVCAADEVRLDREAGLWHTVARHNSKLYILGGWSDSATGLAGPGGGKDGSSGSPCAHAAEAQRGSDELHVLDVDSFELRQLSGPNSKPPHPCCCHTATMVGSSMYVFGGLGPPVDQPPLVMVFDVLQGKWRVPPTSGIPPRQRQGHTANAVQGDRHLCVFGGIEPTGEQRTARVYGDAHLLDLQSFAWRKLEVGGRRPPARFGHSATNLPGSSGKLLVVGGRDHLGGAGVGSGLGGGFTGLHILDTERRLWAQQPFTGCPPAQAFYHSACVLDDQTILFLTSGAGAAGSDAADAVPLHLLDLESWRWSSPRAAGVCPAPRVGHAATVAGGRVYLFGGVVRRGRQAAVDKAVYVLETSQPQRPEREATGKGEKGKGERTKGDAKAAAAASAAEKLHAEGAGAATASHAATPVAAANNGTAASANAGGAGGATTNGFSGHAAAAPRRPSEHATAPKPPPASAADGGGAAAAPAAAASNCSGGRAPTNGTNGSGGAGDGGGSGKGSAPAASRDERIEMMLRESGFDGDLDDATELSFEELLEQEKAFFKAQSEKLSFPRAKDGGNGGGKRNHRF